MPYDSGQRRPRDLQPAVGHRPRRVAHRHHPGRRPAQHVASRGAGAAPLGRPAEPHHRHTAHWGHGRNARHHEPGPSGGSRHRRRGLRANFRTRRPVGVSAGAGAGYGFLQPLARASVLRNGCDPTRRLGRAHDEYGHLSCTYLHSADPWGQAATQLNQEGLCGLPPVIPDVLRLLRGCQPSIRRRGER